MKPVDYLVIAVIVGVVALAIFLIERKRKNGGCSCGCSECPGASSCNKKRDN